MDKPSMFPEIDKVYQHALLIQQRATEVPLQADLVEEALQELLFVLEELRASQVELIRQNNELVATRLVVEWERQRYQALFELAPDGYLVTDRQGKIYSANLAAEDLFAIPQEYLINKPLRTLIHEQDRFLFQNRLSNIQQEQSWQFSLLPQSGKSKVAEISVKLAGDGEEERDTLLWLFRDITDRQEIKR